MREAQAYSRLETDAEYRKRCCTPWCYHTLRGELLDLHIENAHGTPSDLKQRKIITVYP